MTATVAVFGATGTQGGSVARSLLQNSSFRVRAVTRNPASAASLELASSGAEVVQADGFCSEEIRSAFQGAWGAFVNTNSEDKAIRASNGPTEFDLGKSIVDAAAHSGVKHLVFSSGPAVSAMTRGKLTFDAMEMKYRIEQYAKNLGRFETVTAVTAGWYFENFLSKYYASAWGGFPFFADDEGYLSFNVPRWGGDGLVPYLAARDDFGHIVHGIFLNPAQHTGRVIHAASQILSFDQLVADFEQVTGKKSRFRPVEPSWEAFDPRGDPGLEDVRLMFGFTQLTGGRYFGPEPSESTTAAALKRTTALALGMPERQQTLISAKEWFRAHFAQD